MVSHTLDIYPGLPDRYHFVHHLQSRHGQGLDAYISKELDLVMKSGESLAGIFEKMAVLLNDCPENICISSFEWYAGNNRENWEQLVLSLRILQEKEQYYDPHHSFRRVITQKRACEGSGCQNKLKIGATLRYHQCGQCVLCPTCSAGILASGRCKHTPTNVMTPSASENQQEMSGSMQKLQVIGTKRSDSPEDEDSLTSAAKEPKRIKIANGSAAKDGGGVARKVERKGSVAEAHESGTETPDQAK